MAEQSDELRKLFAVATDLVLSGKLRTKAIELIGSLGTQMRSLPYWSWRLMSSSLEGNESLPLSMPGT